MRFKLILCSLIVSITAPTAEASHLTTETKEIKSRKASHNQSASFKDRAITKDDSAPTTPSPSPVIARQQPENATNTIERGVASLRLPSSNPAYSDSRQELCRRDKDNKRKKRWQRSVANSEIQEALEEHQDSKLAHSTIEAELYKRNIESSSDDDSSESFAQDKAPKHIPLPQSDDEEADAGPSKIPMAPVKRGSYRERHWTEEARIHPDKYDFSEQTPWMIIKSKRPDNDETSQLK
ncbi:MAG: hypothetical protein ACTHJ4_02370 [Candidatus Nucleicultricaceae bacterium]